MREYKPQDQIFVRDLCSLTDAAQRLGFPSTRLHRWAERRATTRFPKPVYQHNAVTVYCYSDIKTWTELWYKTRGGTNA